jgi:hypothetical protein
LEISLRASEAAEPTPRSPLLRGFWHAKNLQTSLVGVVHEEEGDAVVVLQITNADVLLVATKVGKGDGLVGEHMDEARVPATMLDMGQPVSLVEAM